MKRKIAPKRKKQYHHDKHLQFDQLEVYRKLRTNIEYSSFSNDLQVVAVTSSNPGEGKSTVAANLATVSMAKYARVLLIDCDLRKPVQHKIFQTSNKEGLSNLMKNLNDFDIHDSTYFYNCQDEVSGGQLYVLTSGMSVPNPQELLSSKKFIELINKCRELFDFIIIDCPPLNVVADAIPVSDVADGTIFVVSAKDTDKRDAKNALTMLQRSGGKVLGSVLTNVDMEERGYYYYYSHYGD